MKKSKKASSPHVRRNPVLVLIIIVLLTIAALIAAKYLSRRPFRDNINSSNQQEAPSMPEEQPEEEPEEIPDKNLDNPIQYEGEDPNVSETLTGTITTARIEGSTALIRVNIDQYLTSGICTINLVSGVDKTYSETVKISAIASTSTCEGFNIPVASLGPGTWAINISISSGDKRGNIIGELNI